jgi:hypothetical protein
MNRPTAGITIVFLLPLLHPLVCLAAGAEWSGKTTIILTGPMQIPGVHRAGLDSLPAGSYVFSIIDAQPGRHICQISNAAETEVLATILALPNYRLRATDRAILLFADALSGQQEALQAWFYPGPKRWSMTKQKRPGWQGPPIARSCLRP